MPPADEPIVTPAAPVAPAPEVPAPAPTESPTAPVAPIVAPEGSEPPAPEPPVQPTPTEPPAAETAPIAEPEADKPKLHTETATLLEEVGKPEAETKPEPPAVEKPAAPAYEPFTLPEGFAANQEQMTAAQQLFAEHNLPQEAAQKLVDFHVEALRAYDAAAIRAQHNAFEDYRAAERARVMADPEIGGAGHATAMTAIAKMRDLFASSARPGTEQYEKDMAEFNVGLRTTGAGDMPWLLRLLHNVARRFDEPAAPSVDYKPPPDIGARPNGAGTRRNALYGQIQPGPNGRS